MAHPSKPHLLGTPFAAGKIAIDREHLIVTGSLDAPRLAAMHPDGTGHRIIIDANGGNICDLWADDRDIYISGDRGLGRIDKAGTFTYLSPHAFAFLEGDDEFLYGSTVVGPDDGAKGVFRIPRVGGDLEWLVRGPCSAVAVHAGKLYYCQHQLFRVREPDGTTRQLARADWPGFIVVFGSDDFAWTQNGLVARVTAGVQHTIATPASASGLLRHRDLLYWGAREPKQKGLWYLRLDGSAPVLAAKFPLKTLYTVANDTHVFWTNGGVYALRHPPIDT